MSDRIVDMSDRIVWTASRSAPLIWKNWDDDEFVVYHTGSGDTHLLNAVSAHVLRQLDGASLTASDLARVCAEDFGQEASDEFRRQVGELLREFDELGLVERRADAERPAGSAS